MFDLGLSTPLTQTLHLDLQHSDLINNNLLDTSTHILNFYSLTTHSPQRLAFSTEQVPDSLLVADDRDSLVLLFIELNENLLDFMLEELLIHPVEFPEVFLRQLWGFQDEGKQSESVGLEVIDVADEKNLEFTNALSERFLGSSQHAQIFIEVVSRPSEKTKQGHLP